MAEKLKIYPYEGGFEIAGNREGLQGLAEVCLALSRLSADAVKTAANHYHFDDDMNNVEAGSVPLVILFKPDL